MTHFNTAFSASSKTDSAFDDLTASLGDARPHPTEDALIQLGRALMTELVDVISDTALEADRFTAFDRRLLAAADNNGCVDDGIGGTDAWTALTRGRLRHLETLGLAERTGRRFRLAPDMEARLRRLQLSKDVIRTLNQRRLDGARSAEQLGKAPVQGKVVKTGFHDELGGSAYVVVRAANGSEHYGRLGVGKTPPAVGKAVTLSLDARGFAQVLSGKQLGQDLGR